MKVAYVKERAFLAMVLSAIEVYKYETLGLLLGYKGGNEFIVEYAIPYQTSIKGYSWVSPKPKVSERIKELVENLPVQVIGDFHSHTEFGTHKALPIPSGDDIADMEKDNIHIIVAVNDREKNQKWRYGKNGAISGTLGDYHLAIAAATPKVSYSYERVKIICPSATGIFYKKGKPKD